MKTLIYTGIDSWNRPVFKNTEAKEFYGCTNILFSYSADEKTVLEKVDESNLCYFGSKFDCEPYGTSAGEIRIKVTS